MRCKSSLARLSLDSTSCGADLKRLRSQYEEDTFIWQAKRQELQRALEDEHASASSALLQAQQEQEQARRDLKVCASMEWGCDAPACTS